MNILRGSVIGLAGLVGAGVLAWPSVADTGADGYLKRDEQETDLVLVDDDDDSNDDTRSRFTGFSKSTRDNTRSNFTKVSRDRDLSHSDKTRDWTRDGKNDSKKRDWSADKTNDRSRNDSRGR